MDAKIKERWVFALRSGGFVQGRLALKRYSPEGYPAHCCLGVLCEVLGEKPEIGSLGAVYFDGIPTHLSPGLLQKAGIDDAVQKCLARRNDRGVPFPEIADYIEQNL